MTADATVGTPAEQVPPEEPQGSRGLSRARHRAGRNLPLATAVGAALAVGCVLIPVYLAPALFAVVVFAAVLVALSELRTALHGAGIALPVIPVALGGGAMVAGAYFAAADGLLVGFVLTVLVILGWRLQDGIAGYLRDTGAAFFVAAYVPLLASFTVLMATATDGADRIVVFVATTIAADIGGLFSGLAFGRHPLAPVISPRKTWEGSAGALIACILVGTGTGWWLLDLALWQGALLGIVLCVVATLGDLVESVIKRDLGIKDMGALLPGHGGVMDRLDSLLPAAPTAWLLFTVFLG